jgi:hypothetical protein
MPHNSYKDWPSVTQITGLLSKDEYLVPWAAKHGTLKAKAILDFVIPGLYTDPIGFIKDDWFKEHKLKREEFWLNHDDLRDRAQKQGVAYHDELETNLRFKYGETDSEPPKPSEHVEALLRWTDLVGLIPKALERHVVSEQCGFHGTFDCLAEAFSEQSDNEELVDWKFTSRIDPVSVGLQLAGYAIALPDENIDFGTVVRTYQLKKPAKKDELKQTANGAKYSFSGLTSYIETRTFKLKHLKPEFLKLLDLYNLKHERGMWAKV